MELFLQILFEFFIEFVLQVVLEVLLEVGLHKLSVTSWERKTIKATFAVLTYFALGFLVGWFSILVFPRSFIRASRLHGISLLITPLLAGLTMACVGWIRRRRGKLVIQLDSFAYGFLFAFGMALVRFLFTT